MTPSPDHAPGVSTRPSGWEVHPAGAPPLRLALVGDGDSPHLAKWVRALVPHAEVWVASSRGFVPEISALVPPSRRLALHAPSVFEGGRPHLLLQTPRLAKWLRRVQPDWVHAHYLSSHGSLAWLALRGLRAPGRLVGSAWGSDILVAPQRSAWIRWLLQRVLAACPVSTSDSEHMAERMRELGAREVMVFPFGLDQLPPQGQHKDPMLFFANRGLEPIYQPHEVLRVFAQVAHAWPRARLAVANLGSLREALVRQAHALGLHDRVQFIGRLDANEQALYYTRAQWYLSLPQSDSVSVSVLEAMAHGCIPVLSDLPANRELVRSGDNGLIVDVHADRPAQALVDDMLALQACAQRIADGNRQWVADHAMFAPAVQRFLARLHTLHGQAKGLGADAQRHSQPRSGPAQ